MRPLGPPDSPATELMLENVLNDVWPYLLLGASIVLTGMGLPVPEEFLVIGAGIASHNHTLEPFAALFICIVAAMLGDCLSYAIGYHFGHGLVREHPRFAWLFNPRTERRMEQKLRQHGLKALIVTRFLVGVRSPVYVAAGILRVPFRYFIVCDLVSASLVVTFFFGLSFLFAEQIMLMWKRIQRAEMALTVAVIAAVLGVVAYFYIRHRRRVARVRLRRLRRKQSRSKAQGAQNDGSSGGATIHRVEPTTTDNPTKSVA